MSGFNSLQSHSAGNLAAAQTTGACVGMLGGTVHDNLNALDVGLPSTVGASVRVAHLDAERNTLIAKITLCHFLHLLSEIVNLIAAQNRRFDMIPKFAEKSKSFFGKIFVF